MQVSACRHTVCRGLAADNAENWHETLQKSRSLPSVPSNFAETLAATHKIMINSDSHGEFLAIVVHRLLSQSAAWSSTGMSLSQTQVLDCDIFPEHMLVGRRRHGVKCLPALSFLSMAFRLLPFVSLFKCFHAETLYGIMQGHVRIIRTRPTPESRRAAGGSSLSQADTVEASLL